MTLNCIIIDDEPLAAELLASYVKRTPFLSLTGTFNNAITGMQAIREKEVHLCFMDIQMPELNGLELAQLIPSRTKVIFTTAFSQYAVDGYKVNALDYLMKPISYDDFLASVYKAVKFFAEFPSLGMSDRFFYVKSDYKLVKVDFDDILFVEGEKDYVKIYLESRETPILSLLNLKKVEECLPKGEFMRTHRSYIVHLTKASVIDRLHFVIGEKRIPISETYKPEVIKYLDSHSL